MKWSVIWTFVKAGGMVMFYMIVFFHILFTGAQVYTNVWLSEWTNTVPGINDTYDTKYWLGVYGALGGTQGESCRK